MYVAGESGHLHCLVSQTGRRVWRRFVGGIGPGSLLGLNGSETQPAVADGQAFAATYDGVLFCINAKSGEVSWKADTGDDTDASPVIYDEFVYACAEERAPFVYCFSRDTAEEIWRFGRNVRGFYSTPAIANDRLRVGAEDGQLHCT